MFYKKQNNLIIMYVLLCTSIIRANGSFKLGIENSTDFFMRQLGKDRRIGLITNQSGIDQQGRRTVDILIKKGFNVTYLFAPEHGLQGKSGSENDVFDSVDKKTNIPIKSLYGNGSGKMIDPKIVKNLDVLMFDIQDSGMRHYTYISTLFHAMKVTAEHGKQLVVFDRPNPLGLNMEGPLVEPQLQSFISIASIPLRHGMTIGELARYFNNNEFKNTVKIHVVKMLHYDRRVGLARNQLSAPLSPGIRSLQACYGYSFLGLLGEIRPFAIGLGTPLPFQCVALPKNIHVSNSTWQKLKRQLKVYGIDSSMHEYTKNNVEFSGIKLQITDINKVRSFNVLLSLLHFFASAGVEISFSGAFDKAIGTAKFREMIAGKLNKTIFAREINTKLLTFFKKASDTFMYTPLPVPILMK